MPEGPIIAEELEKHTDVTQDVNVDLWFAF